MTDTATDYDKPERNLADAAMAFHFPLWLRCIAVVVLAAIIIASLFAFLYFFRHPDTDFTPDKLGIVNLLIFSLFGMVVFLIPWEDYGLRIKKFGPFEFGELLAAQATELATQTTEHVEDIELLRARIQTLENDFVGAERMGKAKPLGIRDTEIKQSRERQETLESRLLEFLRKWQRYGFSPLRIKKWGAKQQGFTDLSSHSTVEIRRALQSLVAKGELETAISQKGNTLYRLPR